MKLSTREYQSGDETNINKLYKLISSRDRSVTEYKWEWVNTWNGVGNIYLLFDEERDIGDKLVCQYSLIPVPFCYFGNSILCGKTENCMSHPDLRGKKIFFPHEQKHFEKAKEKYKIFITTTGKGAPGAIRRKLGYKALDNWIEYYYFHNFKEIQSQNWKYFSKLSKKNALIRSLAKVASSLVSLSIKTSLAFKRKSNQAKDLESIIYSESNVPLHEIEKLWLNNKNEYLITVDRKESFLNWRFNENPYFDHQYLLLYRKKQLVGYLVFHKTPQNTFSIIDVLVKAKDNHLFLRLFNDLITLSSKQGVSGVVCSTLKENIILKDAFKQSRFSKTDLTVFKKFKKHKYPNDKHFYSFVSEDLDSSLKGSVPSNWYITSIVKEGVQ